MTEPALPHRGASTVRRRSFLLLAGALLPAAALSGGCAAIGVIAAKTLPPPTIRPKYSGFANQTVGIMVWADSGVEIDFPGIQLDVGTSLQKKLQDARAADPKKQKQLAGMTFPYPAASFVRYQQEHPEIEGRAAAEVAPLLGVSRLIYLEVERFQTRSDSAVELYRGELVAALKVVEVAGGTAAVAYQEGGVGAVFPPKAPAEGVTASNDLRIYRGLVEEFTTQLAKRFVSYQEEA